MFVLFFLMAISMYLGLKDAQQCLENPLKHGAEKAVSDATGEIHCNCYFENPKYAPFYFTREKMGVVGGIEIDMS